MTYGPHTVPFLLARRTIDFKMSEELEVLKEVAQKLNKAQIAYVISGSIAANYYTIPRMTRDIDVVIELKNADIDRFIKLFRDDFFVDEDMVAQEVNKRGMFNLIHTQSVIKLDFILRKESPWQVSMFLRRQKITVDRVDIWWASLEDLIIAKLWWAKESLSELQLNDVRNLVTSSSQIDRAYIDRWVRDLDLKNVYQKVLS